MKKLAPAAGWIALISIFSALFLYAVLPSRPLWPMTLGSVGLLSGLLFLILDWANIKRSLTTRTAIYGMNAVLLGVVLLVILIFVNIFALRHKHRFDLTETGYFTIAPQTKKVISNLPREVKITAFFSTEDPTKSDFQNLVSGFLELTDKIELTYVDPDKSPTITKQYGIKVPRTIVFESGKQETKIRKPTEESILNSILKVTKDDQKTVYFLDGHGEKNIAGTDKEGYSQIKKNLEKDGFTVKKLLLIQTGAIPQDTDLLIIAGPMKTILPKEIDLIEGYLNKGGSVFLLTDPQMEVGLKDFLKRWGVTMNDDIIIDPMSKLMGGDFAVPVINQYSPHGITSEFTLATVFPLLRSLNINKVEGVDVQELLFSGGDSWAETDYKSGKVKFDEGSDRKGPVPVAAVATKVIPQKKTDSEPQKENPEKPDLAPLKGNLVVMGDSDFATNSYVEIPGNGDFFLNAASWLLEEESLISIRPRERKSSPIQLTSMQGIAVMVSGIFMPLLVAALGFRVWWRRRAL